MAAERLRDLCASEETPIRDALRQMDSAHRGILLVVRPDGRLVGILTDPDVRRLLISGVRRP